MNYMQCEWAGPPEQAGLTNQCRRQGVTILLYGCLNQHVTEIIFCLEHLTEWEEMANDNRAWCGNETCSLHTTAWEAAPLGTVTIEWARKHHRI
jgi:hypothetical protein